MPGCRLRSRARAGRRGSILNRGSVGGRVCGHAISWASGDVVVRVVRRKIAQSYHNSTTAIALARLTLINTARRRHHDPPSNGI